MRFRLTYRGELRPTQRDPLKDKADPLAAHKHRIRQEFHRQLKQLWATNKFLREHQLSRRTALRPSRPIADENAYWGSEDKLEPMADVVADMYRENGYRFVPLVREAISLLCSLEILFLRRDIPGSALAAGDIDNRLKTVIDALRRPRHPNELVGHEKPSDGEDPFFCLMEDDSQVSHLTVETDTFLEPPSGREADIQLAQLVITVDVKPYYVTNFNLSFS
jgi:hypothetical protein